MEDTRDILYKLGELSGKLDSVLLAHSGHQEELKKISERVATLEKSKSYIYGVAAAIGAITSTLIAFLDK